MPKGNKRPGPRKKSKSKLITFSDRKTKTSIGGDIQSGRTSDKDKTKRRKKTQKRLKK